MSLFERSPIHHDSGESQTEAQRWISGYVPEVTETVLKALYIISFPKVVLNISSNVSFISFYDYVSTNTNFVLTNCSAHRVCNVWHFDSIFSKTGLSLTIMVMFGLKKTLNSGQSWTRMTTKLWVGWLTHFVIRQRNAHINNFQLSFIIFQGSQMAKSMRPTWGPSGSAPDGPHVGPMNFAIREVYTDTNKAKWQTITEVDINNDPVHVCIPGQTGIFYTLQ